MDIKRIALAGAAALSMIASPVMAQAYQASNQETVQVERSQELSSASSQLEGENGTLIGILAFAAAVAIVLVIAESDDNGEFDLDLDDPPTSP